MMATSSKTFMTDLLMMRFILSDLFMAGCNIRVHSSVCQYIICQGQMSHLMGKPTICLGENKGADQLRGNREADQRLCFRYTNSTIPLLSKSEISSLQPSSVTVQPGLCRTCSETRLLVFPRGGSNLCLFAAVLVA